jgi:hypothetical protein
MGHEDFTKYGLSIEHNHAPVQIGEGNHQHSSTTDSPTRTAPEQPGGSAAGPGAKASGGFGFVLAVALVLYGCSQLFGGGLEPPKSSFPAENGQRPDGSDNVLVVRAAVDALRSCAQVRVLKPVNCPQQVDGWGQDQATEVVWTLHGDPADGAKVAYNGEEGRFHVLGTAVLTASFATAQRRELRLVVVNYWARIEWQGGQPKLTQIREFDDSPRPATDKKDLRVPDSVTLPLVEKAFKLCVAAKSAPMPPECPTGKNSISAGKAEWHMNGSPVLNAAASFQASAGLIRVVGNYSVTAAYSIFLIGPTSTEQSGKYEAVLSVDAGQPRVLRIRSV